MAAWVVLRLVNVRLMPHWTLILCPLPSAVYLCVTCIPESPVTKTDLGRRDHGMSRNHRKWSPVDLRGFLPKSAVVPDFPSEREPVDRQKEESEVFCPSPVWGPHECQRCGKVYSHHSGLSRHKRQCEGRLQESCGVCGRAFYRSDHYKSHMKHKHGLDVDGSLLPEASFQWTGHGAVVLREVHTQHGALRNWCKLRKMDVDC